MGVMTLGFVLWLLAELRERYTPEAILSSKLPVEGGIEVKEVVGRLRAELHITSHPTPETYKSVRGSLVATWLGKWRR